VNGHGPHMGANESHMGEHEPHVGWMFFEKLPWTKCLVGINKCIMSRYF
jgi:hypothetical protein